MKKWEDSDVPHALQEEDYVTEKYAQALVAGSVPVVIGATNIEDYAVAPNSMLVLQTKEVSCVHLSLGNMDKPCCEETALWTQLAMDAPVYDAEAYSVALSYNS